MMNLSLLLFNKQESRVLIHLLLVFRRLREGMGSDHLRPRWVDTRHQLDLEWMLLGVEPVHAERGRAVFGKGDFSYMSSRGEVTAAGRNDDGSWPYGSDSSWRS